MGGCVRSLLALLSRMDAQHPLMYLSLPPSLPSARARVSGLPPALVRLRAVVVDLLPRATSCFSVVATLFSACWRHGRPCSYSHAVVGAALVPIQE